MVAVELSREESCVRGTKGRPELIARLRCRPQKQQSLFDRELVEKNTRDSVMAHKLHETFLLHQLRDFIILECVDGETHQSLVFYDPVGIHTPTLQIDSLKGDPALNFPDLSPEQARQVFGCLGILRLISGNYLILVEERKEVGYISVHRIYKVTKICLVAIPRLCTFANDDERKLEKGYANQFSSFLSDAEFYFSHTLDITRSFQRLIQSNPSSVTQDDNIPLHQRVDPRFFWNRNVSSEFISRNLHAWILPVMDGFISIHPNCKIFGATSLFDYILISRRSCHRTGSRFETRGVDPEGNAANFVETEQIVCSPVGPVISSFVQTRGSIPTTWHQKSKGIKPKPVVDASGNRFTRSGFVRHFVEQIREYGDQVLVNLVDHRGPEHALGESYEENARLYRDEVIQKARLISSSKDSPDKTKERDQLEEAIQFRYVSFDFHEVCKGNRYENIDVMLIPQIEKDLARMGYFLYDFADSKILHTQTGVVRTNCVDCLDRTNVVQNRFAALMLKTQLADLGILSFSNLEDHQEFDFMFKNVWADNADLMSKQYTGTAALKTDYTRTGKRSVRGTMTDGVTSARRLINKNWRDEDRQLCADIFLGKFAIERRYFKYDWGALKKARVGIAMADGSGFLFPVQLGGPLGASKETKPLEAVLEILPFGETDKNFGTRKEEEKKKVSENKGCIVIYAFGVNLTRKFMLHDIKSIARDTRFHRTLKLYFNAKGASVRGYEVLFRTVEAREKFVEVIQGARKRNDPEMMVLRDDIADKVEEEEGKKSKREWYGGEISVVVGVWDLDGMRKPPTKEEFGEWMGEDRKGDVYIIGVQNCRYELPSDLKSDHSAFSARAHWIYLVQEYMGTDQYQLVAAGSGTDEGAAGAEEVLDFAEETARETSSVRGVTALVVLAKVGDIWEKITGTNLFEVEEYRTKETSFLLNAQVSSPALSPSSSPPASSSTSATPQSSTVTPSIGVKELKNNIFKRIGLKPSSTESSSSSTAAPSKKKKKSVVEGRFFGEGISFSFGGTSFCVINTRDHLLPPRLFDPSIQDPTADSWDLSSDFDHTLWMGTIHPLLVDAQRWKTLYRANPEIHDLTKSCMAVYARSLPNLGLDRVRVRAPQNYEDQNKKAPRRASVSFLLPVRWIPRVASHPSIRITFSSLKAYNLSLPGDGGIGSSSNIDTYLVFDAPFIEEGSKTESTRKSFAGTLPNAPASTAYAVAGGLWSWGERVELKPFIENKAYLKTEHVKILVVDRGSMLSEDAIIGVVAIPLRKPIEELGKAIAFKKRIYNHGQMYGVISGEIMVTSKDWEKEGESDAIDKKEREWALEDNGKGMSSPDSPRSHADLISFAPQAAAKTSGPQSPQEVRPVSPAEATSPTFSRRISAFIFGSPNSSTSTTSTTPSTTTSTKQGPGKISVEDLLS